MKVYVVFAKFVAFDDEFVCVCATPEAANREVKRLDSLKTIASGHEWLESLVIE